MKKLLLSFFAVVVGVGFISQPVYAAPKSNGSHTQKQTTPVGNDISYPQCNTRYPKNQAFGIVGVNDGLANNTNPCLRSEVVWANNSTGAIANQPIAQLYVNTANPGGLNVADWPNNNSNTYNSSVTDPYGTCDGSDSQACAWQYGWNRAVDDVYVRLIPAAQSAGLSTNPASYPWWLDVETVNSWESGSSSALLKNTADLEGMVAYFHATGATVGIYATASQWSQIVGTVSSSSNLNNLIDWLPGARTLSAAQSNCSLQSLTANGKVTITQYISAKADYDNSCI